MTLKISAFDNICELVTDSSIVKILNSQNNSILHQSILLVFSSRKYQLSQLLEAGSIVDFTVEQGQPFTSIRQFGEL